MPNVAVPDEHQVEQERRDPPEIEEGGAAKKATVHAITKPPTDAKKPIDTSPQFGWMIEAHPDAAELRARYPEDSGLDMSAALRRLHQTG